MFLVSKLISQNNSPQQSNMFNPHSLRQCPLVITITIMAMDFRQPMGIVLASAIQSRSTQFVPNWLIKWEQQHRRAKATNQ